MNSIIDLCSSCFKKPKEGIFLGWGEGREKQEKTSFCSALPPLYQNLRTRSTSYFPLIFNLLTVGSFPFFICVKQCPWSLPTPFRGSFKEAFLAPAFAFSEFCPYASSVVLLDFISAIVCLQNISKICLEFLFSIPLRNQKSYLCSY